MTTMNGTLGKEEKKSFWLKNCAKSFATCNARLNGDDDSGWIKTLSIIATSASKAWVTSRRWQQQNDLHQLGRIMLRSMMSSLRVLFNFFPELENVTKAGSLFVVMTIGWNINNTAVVFELSIEWNAWVLVRPDRTLVNYESWMIEFSMLLDGSTSSHAPTEISEENFFCFHKTNFHFFSDACNSRTVPRPRTTPAPQAPTTTPRPNITFLTYKCPPEYATWYCLNGATCFTVKIGKEVLYNCE